MWLDSLLRILPFTGWLAPWSLFILIAALISAALIRSFAQLCDQFCGKQNVTHQVSSSSWVKSIMYLQLQWSSLVKSSHLELPPHLHLSRSLADCWGTTVDFTTNFLHSLLFSAFHSMIFYSRLVHSLMLSSHRFLCLPLRLPPCTVPCRKSCTTKTTGPIWSSLVK